LANVSLKLHSACHSGRANIGPTPPNNSHLCDSTWVHFAKYFSRHEWFVFYGCRPKSRIRETHRGKRVGIILRQKWRRVDASQRKTIFCSPFKQIWFHIQAAVAMSTSLIEYLSCGNCRSVSTIWARCKEVGPRNQVHKWLISSDKKFHCCFFFLYCCVRHRIGKV
jgi:hypothetical protein